MGYKRTDNQVTDTKMMVLCSHGFEFPRESYKIEGPRNHQETVPITISSISHSPAFPPPEQYIMYLSLTVLYKEALRHCPVEKKHRTVPLASVFI